MEVEPLDPNEFLKGFAHNYEMKKSFLRLNSFTEFFNIFEIQYF